jgi:uncharacterized protein
MNKQPSDQIVNLPCPYHPPEKFMGMVRFSRYIHVRDGTRIAIDVYLPDPSGEEERFPAILLQTRYWRSVAYRPDAARDADDPLSLEKMSSYKRRFLSQGYAWIDVDARGTGASFGFRTAEFSQDEVRDGGDIVDWIIRQPWSNGKVGALGMSYEGTTAELLLVNEHPAVKAATPMFSLFDTYADIAFPGGIRAAWFLNTWGAGNEILDRNEVQPAFQDTMFGVRPVDEDVDGTLLAAAIEEHRGNIPLNQRLAGITYREDSSTAAAIDSIDTLSPSSKQESITASGAAVYSISGWFDGAYAHSAVKRFLTLPDPGSKILLGPWNHGGGSNISPFSLGQAGFDMPGELLKFFDYHLRQLNTGIDLEEPVHYFTMGAECWKAASSWPPPAVLTPFYFGEKGKLQSGPPVDENPGDLYRVDYSAGTGEQTRWNSLIGMPLDTPYPDRPDQDKRLLCYTTAPLEEDCEVTGHAVLNLFVVVDQVEADFFVYLEDVDPHGGVNHVSEGLLRGSQRKISPTDPPYHSPAPYRAYRRDQVEPIHPGEVIHLVIDLLPVSYVFLEGHSIRIALSGADKDHFLAPTPEPPTWRILRDTRYASRLMLPLVTES